MKFCAECKAALSLFDHHENEHCNDCLSKKIEKEKPPVRQQDKNNILSDCILSCEDDRIIIQTNEGLILWSSPVGDKNKLGSVLHRAQRILEIRTKRKKK